MAKINIEEAKKRLQKPLTFSATKKSENTDEVGAQENEISYVETLNDNIFVCNNYFCCRNIFIYSK